MSHELSKLIFLLGILLFTVLGNSEGIVVKNEAEILNSTFSFNTDTNQGESSSLRIKGGSAAVIGQFPSQVSLRTFPANEHFCGGSIISNKWILTAASCLVGKGVSDLTVVVGIVNINAVGTSYGINNIFSHEGYDGQNHPPPNDNDIALLEVSGTITFNAITDKIGLGTQPPLTPKNAVVTGWGMTDYPGGYSPVLQYAELTTVPYQECSSTYLNRVPSITIPPSSVCTPTQDSKGFCNGDQGGPLVDADTYLQIGIVSWNIPCATGYPDVYSCVPFHRSWILEKTGVRL